MPLPGPSVLPKSPMKSTADVLLMLQLVNDLNEFGIHPKGTCQRLVSGSIDNFSYLKFDIGHFKLGGMYVMYVCYVCMYVMYS